MLNMTSAVTHEKVTNDVIFTDAKLTTGPYSIPLGVSIVTHAGKWNVTTVSVRDA